MVTAKLHATNITTDNPNDLGVDRVRGEISIQIGGGDGSVLAGLIDDIYRQADQRVQDLLSQKHGAMEATYQVGLPTFDSVTVRVITVPDDKLDTHEHAARTILLDAGRQLAGLASVQDHGLLRAERFLDDLVHNRDNMLRAFERNKAGVRSKLEVILLKLGD